MVIISKPCSASHSVASSTSATHAVSGSHQFKIGPYSLVKLLDNGQCVVSATFTVDDCDWVIKYYPNESQRKYYRGRRVSTVETLRTAVCLERRSEGKEIENVAIKFVLFDNTGSPLDTARQTTIQTFESQGSTSAIDYLTSESNTVTLEDCLKDDYFTIECTVTILKTIPKMIRSIVVPPSELPQDLKSLLKSKEGSDVTFEVSGETFNAHRCVLAARSPVFKAEFFGHMKEKMGETIKVIEMEALIFKAMLHFVYTDSLPDFSDVSENDPTAMFQHLLVAADRYGLERLKILCAEMLFSNIDESNIFSVLALAMRHNCSELKEACLKLITTSNTLKDIMMADGFEYLIQICPSILKDLCKKIGS